MGLLVISLVASLCTGLALGIQQIQINGHGALSAAAGEAVVLGSQPTKIWNPNADCGGHKAGGRAEWLVNNKGMSSAAAREKVMKEFPGKFSAGTTIVAPTTIAAPSTCPDYVYNGHCSRSQITGGEACIQGKGGPVQCVPGGRKYDCPHGMTKCLGPTAQEAAAAAAAAEKKRQEEVAAAAAAEKKRQEEAAAAAAAAAEKKRQEEVAAAAAAEKKRQEEAAARAQLRTCPEFVYNGHCSRSQITGGVACIGDKPRSVQCVPGGRNYDCPSGMTKCLGPEQQAVAAIGAGVCYIKQCGCPGNFKETGCTTANFMPGWCSASARNCLNCQGSWCTGISDSMATKTCTPSECDKCSTCLNNAAPTLSACVTQKRNVAGAACFDPVHQYCEAWSGCEQLGYGCLVKLMCPHPCVCDSWKKMYCDSATTPSQPQDTAKCANLNIAMIQQRNVSSAINTGLDAAAKGRDGAPLSLLASSLKQRSLTSTADLEEHALDSSLGGKCSQ